MRARGEGFTLNTIEKVKLLDETCIPNNCDDRDGIAKMANHLQSTIKLSDMHPTCTNQCLTFEPPKYIESRKEYIGSSDASTRFHERGRIATTFDKKSCTTITQSRAELNLIHFMNTIENDEELGEVSLENLLGIDTEKIGEIKMKINSLIEYFENYECQDDASLESKGKLIDLLIKKRDEIANTEDTIANITVNIDRVKKITYGDKKVKVLFS